MTPNEALQECIKLNPRFSYLCTQVAQYCIHSDGSTSIFEESRICKLPKQKEPLIFTGKSFEDVIAKIDA